MAPTMSIDPSGSTSNGEDRDSTPLPVLSILVCAYLYLFRNVPVDWPMLRL